MPKTKIAVMGAGAFGFAIAKIVGDKIYNDASQKPDLFLYDVSQEYIKAIQETGEHPVFHKGFKVAPHVVSTTSISEAVSGADIVVLGVPSKFLRSALRDAKPLLKPGAILLNLAKGLEAGSSLRISQIVESVLGPEGNGEIYNYSILAGGMIAKEVILGSPIYANLAARTLTIAEFVAAVIRTPHLHIDSSDDIIGTELAGAFKNVLAIGAGIFDGLGYSESSKSAFVSAGAREIIPLAVALGAKAVTFAPGGQAWLGDLMATCFGDSRNRRFGHQLGALARADKWNPGVPKEVYDKMEADRQSVEGYHTSKVVRELSNQCQISVPLALCVGMVCHDGEHPLDFVEHFMDPLNRCPHTPWSPTTTISYLHAQHHSSATLPAGPSSSSL